jgi:hypothetical protein
MALCEKMRETWTKHGKTFGYPECCIKDFITRNKVCFNSPSRVQTRVGDGTRFIPCSYCSWKVMSRQCKLEDLIKDRKNIRPFPQS